MIQVQKKRFGKNAIAIIVTASILALLVIGYIVVDAVINMGLTDASDGSNATQPPEIIDGEALYNGKKAVMYPATSSSKIKRVTVSANDFPGYDGYFSIAKDDDGTFYYYYRDDMGNGQVYYPPICYYEEGFEYTSLYAIADDGMNTYKLIYLLTALSVPYFDERIELIPDEKGHYGKQLATYGLDEQSRDAITVTYLDDNNEEVSYTVYVGNKLVTGVGYYIQIAGRNYVYTSSAAENLSYALNGFASFISPTLVMSGSEMDNAQIPLLTTSYKQWKNVVFDSKDEWGNVKEVLDYVKASAEVVVTARTLEPVLDVLDTDSQNDGYTISEFDKISLDLESIENRKYLGRLAKVLDGNAVKSYEDSPLLATVYSVNIPVKFPESNDTVKYTYKISAIESVLTDDGEYTEGIVGDNNLIKVTYEYLVDGVAPETQDSFFGHSSHAIIDLNDDRIPSDVREYLSSCEVGYVRADNASFDVVYTKDTATKLTAQYIINDITVINEIKDDSLYVVDKVTENSIVTYSYSLLSGGEIIEEGTETIALADVPEDDELYTAIKAALLNQGVQSDYNKLVYEQVGYYQLMMNFVTYEIKSVDYFVSRELITAFRFVNMSERDAFFAESIHANALPSDHKYANYAIDWATCEYVAKLLGGIGAGSSSTNFEGLSGTEVVEVGLSPENMKEYGLYAYTIYFELPRAIMSVEDDFEWLSTVGFTLYISEEQTDGTRYVGSDMYDTIVKIDGDTFYFVEESFIDFWARRDLVMIDYTKLDYVSATVNFDEFKGTYDFDVRHPDAWLTSEGLTFVKPDDSVSSETYEAINVFVSVSGDYTDTKLSEYIGLYGQNFHLANVYNLAAGITGGTGLSIGYDAAGDAYFKNFLHATYSISYVGTLTEAEIADARSREAVLSLAFKVDESSAYEYAYDFHYTKEGKVAVVMYRVDSATGVRYGESCNFYISNFALKKIVNSISDLVNGNPVDAGEGYRDY